MKSLISRFRKDENGFAVVNWAVLVSAFMLLAVFALGTVKDSAQPLSTSAALSFSVLR
ncbi:hypothetical protein [Citreimonas salinaria]|uniref:Uncharacterized protein n=1 Tax=Citreimonas salinaria TaxID=321339 RepID=A0A1H3MQF8_9RHOB|nr:hypothetical protein [Citreimonas salinaria]SDY78740.1 hypothetical protein SAMN05444340_11813 [Citreimonas salinaria]